MKHLRSLIAVSFAVLVGVIGCGDDPVAPGDAPPAPDPLSFFNHHEASAVIGQVGMTSMGSNASTPDVNPQGLFDPVSAGAGTGPFYVVDKGNNRVLGFAGIPTSNGATATFVLGQTDFVSDEIGVTSRALSSPLDCAVGNGELFVVDRGNNRVLIWKSLPTTNNAAAQVVMGQDDFTSFAPDLASNRLQQPKAVAAANGHVFVLDGGNNRVLIWDSSPGSNGEDADVVVGQSNMSLRQSGLSQSEFFSPDAMWTDGRRLIVGDGENARVMIWNSIPATNGEPADVVVGAPDFETGPTNVASATTFRSVSGVASDGTSLFVSDRNANRILIFTPIPTENGAAATNVIGQDSFTADASNDHNQDGVPDSGPTERTLFSPAGLRVQGNRLMVADNDNHRLLIYVSN